MDLVRWSIDKNSAYRHSPRFCPHPRSAFSGTHLFCQHKAKCVDKRCNTENAARKCGVFTYNALLLERKGCKNSIFQNSSFAPARGDIFNALPNLWSGVVRIPRLKNKENQQPLYPLLLFWRVRQRLFLSDGSRTHNLKWAP